MLATKTSALLSINGGDARAVTVSPYAYRYFPKRANPSIKATVEGKPALIALTLGKGRAADGRTRFYFYATPADAPESARGALSCWVELNPGEATALSAPGATLSLAATDAPAPAAPTEAKRAKREKADA